MRAPWLACYWRFNESGLKMGLLLVRIRLRSQMRIYDLSSIEKILTGNGEGQYCQVVQGGAINIQNSGWQIAPIARKQKHRTPSRQRPQSAIMLAAYRKRHATESIAYVSVEGISKLQGLHTVSPRHALFTILLRPVPGAHGPSGRLPAATRCTNGLWLSRAPVRLFMSILEERNVTTTDFDCECPD
jgi:hypothetical protein